MKKTSSFKRKIKTDIIATLGSASDTDSIVSQMIQHGMNMVRINMSHGDHAEHHDQIIRTRKIAKKLGSEVKIIIDLGGPKIRLGLIKQDTYLKEGSRVIITTKSCVGDEKRFSVTYKKLPQEVKKGQTIVIADGKRKLQVVSIMNANEIECKVIVGGLITSRRGVNIPGAELSVPSITSKDKIDMQFAADHNAEYVALSFVRSVSDIKQARLILKKIGLHAKIVSKIETMEAINHLEDIVKASDMIMVARGDLGMEIGYENVPIQQKRMILLGKKYEKPVIIATQMLDSMEKSPLATRAEISDIAFAVYDGADGLMVSGETAVGKYPVEVIKVMHTTSAAIEKSMTQSK